MARSLKLLSEGCKQKAFEKARIGFNIQNKNLVRITETYYKDALNILSSTYINEEPLCRFAGARWEYATEEYWMSVLQQNLSLMILDKDDGDVIGILTMQVETQDDTYPQDMFQDPGMIHTMKFSEIAEAAGNVYTHFNVSETFHLHALTIAKKYRGRGIGTKLVEAAMEFIKGFKFADKVCLKVEGSSNYSKRIFEKVGFTTLFDKPYDEYTEDGKQVLQNTGVDKSMTIYGMLMCPSLSS